MGYSPWGRRESDMIEQLHFLSFFSISIFYLLKIQLQDLFCSFLGIFYVLDCTICK